MEVRASALKLLAHVCLRSDTEHVLADTVIFDSIYLEGAGRYNSSNKALFVNRGFMILEKMLGVPSPSIGSRWIDNWSYLTARDSRFGGEGGGMTVVVNYASFFCNRNQSVAGAGCVVQPTAPPGWGGAFPPPRPPYQKDAIFSGEGVIRFYDCDLFSNSAFPHANGDRAM